MTIMPMPIRTDSDPGATGAARSAARPAATRPEPPAAAGRGDRLVLSCDIGIGFLFSRVPEIPGA